MRKNDTVVSVRVVSLNLLMTLWRISVGLGGRLEGIEVGYGRVIKGDVRYAVVPRRMEGGE